jgi:hypothetical protein
LDGIELSSLASPRPQHSHPDIVPKIIQFRAEDPRNGEALTLLAIQSTQISCSRIVDADVAGLIEKFGCSGFVSFTEVVPIGIAGSNT